MLLFLSLMLLLQIWMAMFRKAFGLIGKESWKLSFFSVVCYLQCQRVNYLSASPHSSIFGALFCSDSVFLVWVYIIIQYMSVRDGFGKPSWSTGNS